MMALVSIYAFMLIPIWIPLVPVLIGYVGDLFRRSLLVGSLPRAAAAQLSRGGDVDSERADVTSLA